MLYKWQALKVYALFITGNDEKITQNEKNSVKQYIFLWYGTMLWIERLNASNNIKQ